MENLKKGVSVCYAKPGPRCSSSSKAILEAAEARLEDNRTPPNYKKYQNALEEYKLSPEWIKNLKHKLQDPNLSDAQKDHLETELRIAKHSRAMKMAHYRVEQDKKDAQIISLPSNVGIHKVVDGDLHDPAARVALSAGLCPNLALAINKSTHQPMFGLIYRNMTQEEFQAEFDKDPKNVFNITHVVVASECMEDNYVDSYGRSTREDLEERYGEASLVPVSRSMVEYYAGQEKVPNLDQFANQARLFDLTNIQYEWDENDFDVEDEEWEDEEWEDEEWEDDN